MEKRALFQWSRTVLVSHSVVEIKNLEEVLQFAADGKVKTIVETASIEEINQVFDDLEKGKINNRIVIDYEA